MSQPIGHEVDVPITNLDEEDDDIVVSGGDNNSVSVASDLFRMEDYENDNDSLNLDNDETEASLTNKIKYQFNRIFGNSNQNQYIKFKAHRDNDIELEDRNSNFTNFSTEGDGESILNFEDFTDLGLNRRRKQSKTITLNKYQFYFLIIGFLTFLIGFSVVISKNKKQNNNKNTTITNGGLQKTTKEALTNGTHDFYPTTILISLDGFHPHYISKDLTPFMHNLMIDGYGAPFMIPSFPSSTFPNHWTLATGLYPSDHGIVGNTFYDPVSKRQFINTNPKLSLIEDWWGGESIWHTANLQGVSTAVHMWPGSEVPFTSKGGVPMEFDRFNGSEVLSKKIDRVLGWLDRNISSRPELILSYVPTIDSLGHKFGISGEKLDEGLGYVDNFLETLYIGLKNRNLTDVVNVVIVSDHGMAPTSNNRIIFLDDMVNLSEIEHIDGWPLFGLRPFSEYSIQDIYKEIMDNRNKDLKNGNKYDVYLKQDLPKEWTFAGNIKNQYSDRIAPLWIVPKVGYSIITHEEYKNKNYDYTPKGVHGYNNTEVLMRALFLGTGPFFKDRLGEDLNSLKIRPFENIEVYNIICDSLNLKPAPNNGTITGGTSIVNSKYLLPQNFEDLYDYPNVSFVHDVNIMRENATYDTLWRNKTKNNHQDEMLPTDKGAFHSTGIEAFSSIIPPQSVPDPTYYSSMTDKSHLGEATMVETSKTDTRTTVSTKTTTTSKSKPSKEGGKNHHNDDHEDDDDKDNHHKGGFFDAIADIFDDVGDVVDDVVDAVENTFDNIVGHDKPNSGKDED